MRAASELGGSTRAQEHPAIELFGVPVDSLTMDETIEAARALVRDGGVHQHVAVNAAKLVEVQRNPALREVIWTCDIVSADGQAVLWASRILGHRLPERVAGIDLFERLVGAAARDGSSVYFLGATDEVVQAAVAVMTERHPALRVAGARDGYWQDDHEVVAAVRAARPDYLFLAIPSPRKEFFLKEHLESLGVPFVMGVGGSFDVVAGKVGRAPRWVQRAGFEWAWRLGQEPGRMWKRYLDTNTVFIWMVFKAWRRGR
jgi:N-acetylglucosaminyldiphosphoundecaprenol N-acetyl-beta-D-mannosaminyltransferase